MWLSLTPYAFRGSVIFLWIHTGWHSQNDALIPVSALICISLSFYFSIFFMIEINITIYVILEYDVDLKIPHPKIKVLQAKGLPRIGYNFSLRDCTICIFRILGLPCCTVFLHRIAILKKIPGFCLLRISFF